MLGSDLQPQPHTPSSRGWLWPEGSGETRTIRKQELAVQLPGHDFRTREVLDINELWYRVGGLWQIPVLGPHPTAFDAVVLGWVEKSGFSQAPHWPSVQGTCRPLFVKFYIKPSIQPGTAWRPSLRQTLDFEQASKQLGVVGLGRPGSGSSLILSKSV